LNRPRVLSVLLTAGLLAPACSKPLSDSECERLLDHYTEHLLRNEKPDVTFEMIHQKQAEARALAKSDATFEFHSCADDVTRAQYECAIIAPSIDAIEKCLML